jgi:hypothetical protein
MWHWVKRLVRINRGQIPLAASRYEDEFRECVRFMRSRSIAEDDMLWVDSQGAPVDRLMPAIQTAMKCAGITASHFDGAAGQCLKWSHFLAPHVAKATGFKAWPTLGQLWKGETKVFGPTWLELERLLRDGTHAHDLAAQGRQGVDWHAWITLETGELIDFTFASTMAIVFPDTHAELRGGILVGQPAALIDGHHLVPMLAGIPAIEAIQSNSSLPLLASSVDALRWVNVALVFEPRP